MKVQVRLFARYREAAGRDRVELDLPEGGTVEAAWEAVTSRFPSLSAYRPFTLFAVGNDYVGPERSLRPGEELCLFPPVSGGSDDLVDLVAAPLSEKALVAAVEDPGAGAVVLFSGVVRDQTGGRRVKFLEYEAHAPMAVAKMREIAAAARQRYPGIRRLALVHRVGRLEIGESSVLIAVSTAHRGEGFDACRFAIDTLKETVPIWKKEFFEDGEVWVGLQSECDHRH
ncbi:MAG TPA: molybdenum cofactor biosynthesis protein MoaE [Candidatus Nitrosocosmicus sp.]|jgi:molybdopterin synthase catalytic subunit|nr:molybdenum cofactor biosynthesis protein MoaE [Candidatus Nitrosocosmicus sp.]